MKVSSATQHSKFGARPIIESRCVVAAAEKGNPSHEEFLSAPVPRLVSPGPPLPAILLVSSLPCLSSFPASSASSPFNLHRPLQPPPTSTAFKDQLMLLAPTPTDQPTNRTRRRGFAGVSSWEEQTRPQASSLASLPGRQLSTSATVARGGAKTVEPRTIVESSGVGRNPFLQQYPVVSSGSFLFRLTRQNHPTQFSHIGDGFVEGENNSVESGQRLI